MLDSAEKMNLLVLGKHITLSRREKCWSQAALSKFSGVSRQRISQMENGSFQGRITDLLKVIHTLGLRLEAANPVLRKKEPKTQKKPVSKPKENSNNAPRRGQKQAPHQKRRIELERQEEFKSGILQSFKAINECIQQEEDSLAGYLGNCNESTQATAAAKQIILDFSEPELVDLDLDPRLAAIFYNKVIKRYPELCEAYGTEALAIDALSPVTRSKYCDTKGISCFREHLLIAVDAATIESDMRKFRNCPAPAQG